MACVITAFSCKKEMAPLAQGGLRDPTWVDSLPVTDKDKDLVDNLGKMTDVLKELYVNKENLKIVNAAIFAHAYTDESILVKDLIFPGQSRLNDNQKFKNFMEKWHLSLGQFAENFWKEVSKTKDENFKKFLNGLGGMSTLGSGRTSENPEEVTIYFPYTEDREAGALEGYYEPITTLVTATADADQGIGYQPYYVSGVLQYYKEVVVDDEYAFNNPTQIVGLNGVEPYYPPLTVNTAFPPGPAIDLPDFVREVKQVYIGDVRIYKKQFDKLISFTNNGGGSEIRFTRADGFLKVVDGQVQTADVMHTPYKEVSRYDIRNYNWVNVSYSWDGDWENDNLQQNLGIYEEDNRNSATFSGSLTTTVTAVLTPINVTTAGTLGFTISFKSDDDLIRQINFNRDVFFALNRINLEGEMHNGWPVRDRTGPVSYTLNDRTIY